MIGPHDPSTLRSAETFLAEARANLRNLRIVEAQVRDTFTSHLPRIFPDMPYWVRRHITGSESALRVVSAGRTRTVFTDNLVDFTPIEYETTLKNPSKFAEGLRQVQEQAAGVINAGAPPGQVIGVLSDTLEWRAYSVAVITGTPIGSLGEVDIALTEIETLDLHAAGMADAQRLLDFLQRHLGRLCSRPISPENISSDLGFNSPFAASRIAEIDVVVRRAFGAKSAYGQLIERLWNNFVGTLNTSVHAKRFDLDVYIAEFYLVTLAKLLCANALVGRPLQSDTVELRVILNGEFFRRRNLENVVEYDYFGWLNEDPFVDAVASVAALMQKDLLAYDFGTVPTDQDIFGPLMAQLANRTQRLLLGQEWTPGWLAEAMAEKAVAMLPEGEFPRFIDMCCGSGAMIAKVLALTKGLLTDVERTNPDLAVARLSRAVTGFDIDPLAILMARITWLLSVRPYVSAISVPLTIPIYHADSLFVVTPLGETGAARRANSFALDLDGKTVEMPEWLLRPQYQRLFDEALQESYAVGMSASLAAANRADHAPNAETIGSAVGEWSARFNLSDEERTGLAEAVALLAVRIGELNLAGRNGIWAFILRNSYRPSLMVGNFNGLVSNPPWLAMSKVADNPYREALARLAEHYGIRPLGAAFPHLDLATVFLMHAFHRYLGPQSVVACVVPQTVLNGHHHTPLRRMTGPGGSAGLALTEIWEVGREVFKNTAAVLFAVKDLRATSGTTLPGAEVSRGAFTPIQWHWNAMGQRAIWSKTAPSLASAAGFYQPADFQQGADLMPRRLVFVEVLARRGDKVRVRSIARTHPAWGFAVSDAKAPFDAAALAGEPWVHESFVFGSLLSKHLSPFHVAVDHPVPTIAPMRRGTGGRWELMTRTQIEGRDRQSAVVFAEVASILQRIKRGSRADLWTHYLNFRGKLARQVFPPEGYLVLTGAGGDWLASAYLPLTDAQALGDLLIDQTLYWAVVSSENAARYLTGLFNSQAIHAILQEFVPRGAFGGRHQHTLPFRVTPPYDEMEPSHQDVVATTRALQTEVAAKRHVLVATQDPFDPAAKLQWRRKKLREFIQGLDSYAQYESTCRALYGM